MRPLEMSGYITVAILAGLGVIFTLLFLIAHAKVLAGGGKGWARTSLAAYGIAAVSITFFFLRLGTSVDRGFIVLAIITGVGGIHLAGMILYDEVAILKRGWTPPSTKSQPFLEE